MTFTEKTNKPRLLYVENFLPSFQSSRLSVAQAAAAHGFDVHVAVPLRGADASSLDGCVEWHDLAMDRNLRPSGQVETLRCLIALYGRLRPDVVHHIRTKAIVFGSVAARALRVPAVINTLTGFGHVYNTKSIKALLLRTPLTEGLRLASRHPNQRMIVQNLDDFAACIRWRICPAERLVLIKGSGVDLEKYRPVAEPPGPVLVILPARMLWDKGVREFVAAARQIKASGLRARFALVGGVDPDSPAALMTATLDGWAQDGIVEWWGWRDDMNEVLAQCHIVCLPSYGEGAPRALMEAAACARAAVATDVPGCRDVVRHGHNGLLVPSRNVSALADALRRLITDSELRRTLAKNGPRMMAEGFTRTDIIARNLAVYKEVLNPVRFEPGLPPGGEQFYTKRSLCTGSNYQFHT